MVDAAVGIYVSEAPDVAAPRTGRGLMPGEEVEIVERVVVDDAKGGRTFLRLADGGWAMERPSSGRVPILRVSSGAECLTESDCFCGLHERCLHSSWRLHAATATNLPCHRH